MKWKANTDAMIKKAYARLWMVKKLKSRRANLTDLIDVYMPTEESSTKKKNRKRNMTWFNPPYSANVKTNLGKEFL